MPETEILDLAEQWKEECTDAMLVNLDGRDYYLVYGKIEASGLDIPGLVRADIVNASMNNLQLGTMFLVGAVVCGIAALLIGLIIQKSRRSLKRKDTEILYRDELFLKAVDECG